MKAHQQAAGDGRRGRRRIAAIPALGLIAAFALVAGGCGDGSDDDSAANDAYADSVCTAVGGWKQDVTNIVSGISLTNLSKQTLETKLSDAKTSTENLVTEIKAVPPPDSSDGEAAQQQVEQFASDVTTTINSAESAVADLQDNVSAGAIQATLALLAPQFKALVSSGQSAVDSLKTAGGSLSSAFEDTASCKSLTD